jgi:hypothetical protein
MSRCTLRDDSPTFEPQRRPRSKIMTRDRRSTALFVDAEAAAGHSYKRYVTKECQRDPAMRRQIQAHLRDALRGQEERAARMAADLSDLDREARTELPALLNELKKFRKTDGQVVAVVQHAIDAIQNLDTEGKTCAYLWLIGYDADRRRRWGGHEHLTGRAIKRWSAITREGKEVIKRKLADLMLLLNAPEVKIAPATGVRECPNMLIRRGRRNDFLNLNLHETVDFADAFVRVRTSEATFCVPIAVLEPEPRDDLNPIQTTIQHGAAATRQATSHSAYFSTFVVHLNGVFTEIQVPRFRLLRIYKVT